MSHLREKIAVIALVFVVVFSLLFAFILGLFIFGGNPVWGDGPAFSFLYTLASAMIASGWLDGHSGLLPDNLLLIILLVYAIALPDLL